MNLFSRLKLRREIRNRREREQHLNKGGCFWCIKDIRLNFIMNQQFDLYVYAYLRVPRCAVFKYDEKVKALHDNSVGK